MRPNTFLKQCCYGWLTLGVFILFLGAIPSTAQSKAPNPYFAKLGIGFSDYTGDFPSQNSGYPIDLQDFARSFAGTRPGFPLMSSSEFGYRPTQQFAAVLGLVGGSYPTSGSVGEPTGAAYRYTLQLLGRYTFGTPGRGISPYADGGFNLTVGGYRPGYGPSLGGGITIPFNSSVSLFVESRFNFTYPDDALDGDATGDSFPKRLDSVNQLLGFGLKVHFSGFSKEASPDRSTRPQAVPDTIVRRAQKPVPTASRPDTTRYEESVRVPSGTFIMGLTDEDPLSLQNAGRRRVTVSAFYIEQYEVTNAEYRKYLSQLSSEARTERLPDSTAWSKARSQESWDTYFRADLFSNYPVLAVTWEEAQAYCQAQDKRLPTEAEWEYAARGGYIGRVYPWEGLSVRGPEGEYLANFNPSEGYAADGHAFTAPVDAFPPNDWDLYNMAGNVAEWTRDAYTPSYDNLSDFNPHHRDEDEPRRVVRGGAWNSNAFAIGVGARDTHAKEEASVSVGFRCVQDVGTLDQDQSTNSSPENRDTSPSQSSPPESNAEETGNDLQ